MSISFVTIAPPIDDKRGYIEQNKYAILHHIEKHLFYLQKGNYRWLTPLTALAFNAAHAKLSARTEQSQNKAART